MYLTISRDLHVGLNSSSLFISVYRLSMDVLSMILIHPIYNYHRVYVHLSNVYSILYWHILFITSNVNSSSIISSEICSHELIVWNSCIRLSVSSISLGFVDSLWLSNVISSIWISLLLQSFVNGLVSRWLIYLCIARPNSSFEFNESMIILTYLVDICEYERRIR